MSGLFVVLEGGDGAGKSTQLARLATWLTEAGHEVVVTYEPGDTVLGATLRKLLLDHASGDVSPRAEAMLYAADKAQHVYELVRPALDAGKVVVCDRYVDSMIAYQGAGRVLDVAEVRQLTDWATNGLLPDLTVVLDVPVERALGEKVDLDRLEAAGTEFHERVREHFLDLAAQDPGRYLVLPGREDRDAIEAAIRERVTTLLDAPV
jgi:dTMP kinase